MARDYDGHAGWKAGLIDLNVDFDVQETGALFLDSADGIGPEFGHSGRNGPSIYPTTALGITGYLRPRPEWTLRVALLDGTAGSPEHPDALAIHLSGRDGVLVVAQAERRTASGLRFEAGVWTYSAYFDAVDQPAVGPTLRLQNGRGGYATIESRLIVDAGDPERGLSGWLRGGIADPQVHRVSGSVETGLVYTGLLAARPADQLGVAVSRVFVHGLRREPGDASGRGRESTVELTYRYFANDWLAVQPDLQIIEHPGGAASAPTALVVGVRLSVALTHTLLGKVLPAAQ